MQGSIYFILLRREKECRDCPSMQYFRPYRRNTYLPCPEAVTKSRPCNFTYITFCQDVVIIIFENILKEEGQKVGQLYSD